jgi:Arc/MetJ-type ribon-helix-helix transcriptional regulator
MAGAGTTVKVTFSLPADLVRRARELVAGGHFPSQNALVRAALERELREARENQLRAEYEEAARDPLFLRDIEEAMRDFAAVDSETARMIPDG